MLCSRIYNMEQPNSKLIFLIESLYSNGICLFILITQHQKDYSLDFFSFLLLKELKFN